RLPDLHRSPRPLRRRGVAARPLPRGARARSRGADEGGPLAPRAVAARGPARARRGARRGALMFHPGGPTFRELMRQALSSTDEGYDLLAPKFDKTPFRTPDALLEAMVPHFGAAPVRTALDVCCGTGAAT